MKRIVRLTYVAALTLLVGGARTVAGDARTWEGAVSTDWFDADNWVEDAVPVAGDDVTIASGTALLTNGTPALASLSLTGTLVFTNWNTTLTATNVLIASGGVMTLPPAFANNAMSNNVVIVCSNLTVASGGAINADGKGYAGGVPVGTGSGGIRPGYGPGGGNASFSGHSGGAGHGGFALKLANETGGRPYGSPSLPLAPGSGGRSGYVHSIGPHNGGDSGGAVRITASGDVVVEGVVSADGTKGGATYVGGGGGSGGSILILCRTLSGNGTLRTNGGDGGESGSGAGAGGRIAIHYDANRQAAISPKPVLAVTARPGSFGRAADIGSLFFADATLLSETLGPAIAGQIWGVTDWAPAALTVSNTWIRFAEEGVTINVAGDARISGVGARLELGGGFTWANRALFSINSDLVGPTFTVGGNLVLTTGGALAVYAAQTNYPGGGVCGADVTVAGDLSIAANSWLQPYAHPTNGGSPRISVRGLTVAATGGINADAAGYLGGSGSNKQGYGPGGGPSSTGYSAAGGHGGRGGRGSNTLLGGAVHGRADTPVEAGSGGGSGGRYGGAGGGVVWIEVAEDVLINGTLTANGEKPTFYIDGGGAGGGVFIRCRTIAGGGVIRALGGDGATTTSCGGGGGGRIAVHYDTAAQAAIPVPGLTFSTSVGAGFQYGDVGTLWFSDNRFLAETFVHSGEWNVPGFSAWAPAQLTVNGGWLRLPFDAFDLDVAGSVAVVGTSHNLHRLEASRLTAGGGLALTNAGLIVRGLAVAPVCAVSGSIQATNAYVSLDGAATTGATLRAEGNILLAGTTRVDVFAGMTNGAEQLHGAVVESGGELRIGNGATVCPYSHNENGGSPFFRVGSMAVAATGKIDADAKGFRSGIAYQERGKGPGGGLSGSGAWSGGGGYGGKGGDASTAAVTGPRGGPTNGLSFAPTLPGSGAGKGYTGPSQGDGGGLVWVRADGAVTLLGMISANGQKPNTQTAGGGAGGGILIECASFAGAGGTLSAKGGDSVNLAQDGGGGGGRIAIWYGAFTEVARADLIAGRPGEVARLRIDSTQPDKLGSFTAAVNGGAGVETGGLGSRAYVTISPPPGTVLVLR